MAYLPLWGVRTAMSEFVIVGFIARNPLAFPPCMHAWLLWCVFYSSTGAGSKQVASIIPIVFGSLGRQNGYISLAVQGIPDVGREPKRLHSP